ncbi:MAG TPA: apolipoprotein N-acyltransferase [Vicinamibacterales bacterium]|nr:apolipoprotein N-acyltransferase [Vicinamibacterales bacterium]
MRHALPGPRRSVRSTERRRHGRPSPEAGVQATGYPLALLSGLLLAASFPKFGHPAFAWVALAPLLVAVVMASRQSRRSWRVAVLGVVAGFVFFVGTLYWIGGVMAAFGGLNPILAYALMGGLALHLSLFVGLFAWLACLSVRRFGLLGVWMAPALWVASEWLRAWLGWGFPWVLLGSSQAAVVPIVQLASVTGVYGLSALLALTSTAAASLALNRGRAQWLRAAGVAALVVMIAVLGTWRASAAQLTREGTPIRVGLLQGNVPQEAKSNPALSQAITQTYLTLSRQALMEGAQLVLWPEASAPFIFAEDEAAAEPIRRLAAQAHVPFVIGTDEIARGATRDADRWYNAATLVGSDGRTQGLYRKVRLVPFGEYVPFKRLLFFVGPLIEAVSDFTPGDDLTVFETEGSRFSVAICYEAVYAGMAQTFVSRGSQLLTTITNDAWFGRSSAAYQHFEQASLRAVEQGRYLVRAANTGISGAVDPYGRVLRTSALFDTTELTVDARLLSGHTIYHAIGDVVAWASLVLSAFVVWRARGVGRSQLAGDRPPFDEGTRS